jgi:hypothetical protein
MSARYVIVMKQAGEGCDYTIGCGMRMVEIGDFDRPEQAIEAGTKKFRELHTYYGLGGEERELSFVGTFCLMQDLMPLYQQIGREKQEVADAEARAAKRQQLEKLKRELGEA